MSITINDGGLLRRLVEGDLRSDGVTDCQRERLEKLVGLGAVERVERLRFERDQALATAEAASGAGEADQTKADYCPGYCARGEPHNGSHDPVVLHRQSGGQTAEVFTASLPPATDPAIVEKLQIEREGYRRIAINAGWSGSLERAYGRDEYLRHRIAGVDSALANRVAKGWDRDAALAAAQTIPATGEAGQ